jgi:putative MATE family efflux protein
VLAATQSLGIGTTTLISHAAGEKHHEQANRIFNQALVLSLLGGTVFLVAAFLLRGPYSRWLAADSETAQLASQYLLWFLPALALQFPLITMGAALRGAGVVKPTVVTLMVSVCLNLVLAPVLIFGWGTGMPFGISGAAIASLIALVCGSIMIVGYFFVREKYLEFQIRQWRPVPEVWRRVLAIGLPSGAELALLAVYLLLVYVLIRPFGVAAQGGFAIGARVNQSLVLPAVAVGMANAPIVGQSFGARDWNRIRQAFTSGCVVACGMMMVMMIVCQVWPQALVRPFSHQPDVVLVSSSYLRAISLTYIATALIFATASVFQGIGNTRPPFVSSLLRVLIFAVSVAVLSHTSFFNLDYVWYISAGSIMLQAIMNLVFLWRELRRKTDTETIAAMAT